MIIGIGTDLCDIRRIERSLARFGDRFRNRVFTPIEQRRASLRGERANNSEAGTYAKRFAAKEACAKASVPGYPWACAGPRWKW